MLSLLPPRQAQLISHPRWIRISLPAKEFDSHLMISRVLRLLPEINSLIYLLLQSVCPARDPGNIQSGKNEKDNLALNPLHCLRGLMRVRSFFYQLPQGQARKTLSRNQNFLRRFANR